MLKRLVQTILSKAAQTETQQDEAPQTINSAVPAEEPVRMVKAVDGYGREIQIPLATWRDQILQPNLKLKWDDPDALYELVLSALNDQLFCEVLDAARQLVSTDPNIERSHTILAIAAMKCGLLDEADQTLHKAIGRVGKTGTLLTNLAKVQWERGEESLAEKTLTTAVQTDPNMENGLNWWLLLHKDRGGEAAYREALQTAASIASSWLPQLYLAQDRLAHDEIESALTFYRAVLQARQYHPSALMKISGDLGNKGQIKLIPELIAPVYETEHHDIRIGLNLAQAYLALGSYEEGESLLAKLYLLGLSPYKQYLDRLAGEFAEQRKRAQPTEPLDVENLEFSQLTLTQPIWNYSLKQPDWLCPSKPEDSPVIACLVLARRVSDHQKAEKQQEDDTGRLSRSIALYFAESIHEWTSYAGHTLVPIVKGGGPVVFGNQLNITEVFAALPDAVNFCLGGELQIVGETITLQMTLWQRQSCAEVASWSIPTTIAEIGHSVRQIELELLKHLGPQAQTFDSFYSRPVLEMLPTYLAGLGQSLMLTLAANDFIPATSLWGERTMLEWPLKMALQWPQVIQSQIMYISGLSKAALYGSTILPAFKSQTLQFLGEKATADTQRLSPLVNSLFGLLQQAVVSSDESYLRWVQDVTKSA